MVYSYTYKSKLAPKRANDEEESGEDQTGLPLIAMNKKPYKEYAQTFTAQHVHYYISESIGAPGDYTDMIYRITCAGPSDTIFIHLNTPGGQLDTGVQIVNAMQNSQAKIVTILEGSAYSLGTLIFLAGDEMVVNDNCMMMFHNFNGGLIGKGNELVSELEATIKWFASLARDIYVPFISEEEFTRIAKGEDFWMQSPEIRTRLQNMIAEIEKQEKAIEKAIEQAIAADAAEQEVEVEVKPKRTPRKPAKKAAPRRPRVKKEVEGTD